MAWKDHTPGNCCCAEECSDTTGLVQAFSDDFSGDLSGWTNTSSGATIFNNRLLFNDSGPGGYVNIRTYCDSEDNLLFTASVDIFDASPAVEIDNKGGLVALHTNPIGLSLPPTIYFQLIFRSGFSELIARRNTNVVKQTTGGNSGDRLGVEILRWPAGGPRHYRYRWYHNSVLFHEMFATEGNQGPFGCGGCWTTQSPSDPDYQLPCFLTAELLGQDYSGAGAESPPWCYMDDFVMAVTCG